MALILPTHGDGILLRDFRQEDAALLADIGYDPEAKKYLALPGRDRTEWIRLFSPDQIAGYAVEALPDQVLAGQADISRTDSPRPRRITNRHRKEIPGTASWPKGRSVAYPSCF